MIVILLTAFCIFATYLIFASHGHWLIKSIMVAIIFGASSYAYFSAEGLKGWPTSATVPPDAELQGVVIIDRTSKTEGAIFVWVVSDEAAKADLWEKPIIGTPRSFSVPYTENNAKAAYEMKKALKAGKAVTLNKSEKGEGEGEGQTGDKEGASGYLDQTGTKYAITNPASQLPTK